MFTNVLEIKELKSYDDQDKRGEKGDEEERKVKFRLIGPLSKVHNVVVYIRGLTTRITEFLKLIGREILLNNYTR